MQTRFSPLKTSHHIPRTRQCWLSWGVGQPIARSISSTAVTLVILLSSHGLSLCSANLSFSGGSRYSDAWLDWAQSDDPSYYPSDQHALAPSTTGQLLDSKAEATSPSEPKIATEGDVVFGGLFPMHEQGVAGTGQTCGRIKREKGIQRLEAMLYAVDLINSDPEILPGLTIGMHVLDTCSDDTFALEQCMDFIKAQLSSMDAEEYWCQDLKPPIYRPMRPVAGVIGAASSPVSIMVANILRLFKYKLTSIMRPQQHWLDYKASRRMNPS
ncbi:hypothetical protein RRG08_029067 [Elysia crispata]|uniref:Receptor ligand binding region domain-containing protein n=1 Tax=Elysia crispata TaxID=231223 RepID=A0AAE0ZKS7_9GAST|nr:hypothetical protein RRG08_029067 [Elysia crispata]